MDAVMMAGETEKETMEGLSAQDNAVAQDTRKARIEDALDKVRPFLRQDGGDIHLVDVEGKNIYVKMSGACVGCQLATVTLGGVQKRLIEALGEPVRIIPAEMRDRMTSVK